MSTLLRFTRYLIALTISAHVASLRTTVTLAERRNERFASRVNAAEVAKKAATMAVADAKATKALLSNAAHSLRTAATAEAAAYGQLL